MATIAILNLF